MKNRFTFLLAAALFLSASLSAQDKVVKNVIALGKTDNRTMAHADMLANRIGGRPIGSHNLEDAEKWVEKQFRSWGLEVMVQEVGQMSVGFSRGPWKGRMLGGPGMDLHFVTPSYTAGTRGPQKGHVLLEPQSREEFERMKGALKGAWVLIGGTSSGFPLDWTSRGDSVRLAKKAVMDSLQKVNNSIRMWNWEHPSEKKELVKIDPVPGLFCHEMEEAGVLGFIQAADLPMQAMSDRLRSNANAFTMETLPTVCEIKLDRSQFTIVERMARERQDFLLEFDIRNHFFEGPVKYHNVIGIIRGSKYPGEYVLMGGHLDSYDVASGAVDDANGVSVVMEAARMLSQSGARPLRTMMFCIWTGEENGLLGSKYFVENKTVPLEKISNYFNRDGGPLAAAGLVVPEAMYKDFKKICGPVMDLGDGIPFTLDKRQGEPRPRPKTAGGSDHAHFAMEGVPTISFSEKDVFGYNFNYRTIWHTECDDYTHLIPEYMDHSSVVTAIVAYGVACLPHLLSREGLYAE